MRVITCDRVRRRPVLESNSETYKADNALETKHCCGVTLPIGTNVVTVIDTPGFDDDELSDGTTLSMRSTSCTGSTDQTPANF